MTDPFFYLFCIIISTLLFLALVSKKSNVLSLLICIIFALIATFRSENVPDTSAYIEFFSLYNLDFTDFQHLGHEPGFIIFGKIIKSLVNDYRFFFLAITIVNLLLIYRSLINFQINPAIGLATYISFYGIYFNFIFLRAGIATSIFIYSISLFHSKRKIRAATSLSSAPLFHFSVIPQIALLPIIKIKSSKKILNLLLATCIIIYLSGIADSGSLKILHFIGAIENLTRYSTYVDNIKFNQGISIRFLMNCLVVIAAINLTKNFQSVSTYAKLSTLGLLIGAFFSSFLWADRISDAFVVFIFILLTAILSDKTLSSNQKSILYTLIVIHFISNLFFISRISTHFLLD